MITLRHGDNRDVLKTLADNSIDSIVTDPPYALVSIVKRFGGANAAPAKGNEAYARASAGFMGKQWDTGEVAFAVEFWSECLRVLKPGGHVVAFSGTRTYHRMACAIEDAGFEIRDQLQWLYGTGFPKSHNQGNGWGTALKPANEPIVLARKPLSEKTVAANVLAHGTGAINVDGCRVGIETLPAQRAGQAKLGTFERHDMVTPERIGRWPANVIHDGSDEVVGAFPETGISSGGKTRTGFSKVPGWDRPSHANWKPSASQGGFGDEGSAARFFYSAKASKADRAGSKHPTVKPIKLMQWLCRLVTPPGGTVLDPFAGSGTTGAAAIAEGFNAILIEREAEYFEDIKRRFNEPEQTEPQNVMSI